MSNFLNSWGRRDVLWHLWQLALIHFLSNSEAKEVTEKDRKVHKKMIDKNNLILSLLGIPSVEFKWAPYLGCPYSTEGKYYKTITVYSGTVYLINTSPVLFVFMQHPFPKHSHHFREMFICECVLCDLLHCSTMWAPGIVIGGFPDFGLHLWVIHHHIGAENNIDQQNENANCNSRFAYSIAP